MYEYTKAGVLEGVGLGFTPLILYGIGVVMGPPGLVAPPSLIVGFASVVLYALAVVGGLACLFNRSARPFGMGLLIVAALVDPILFVIITIASMPPLP